MVKNGMNKEEMDRDEMKSSTNEFENSPRDDSTRTPGIKLRHLNANLKKIKKNRASKEMPEAIGNPVYDSLTRKQQERMSHVEEAQIKGLFHRHEGEKGIKK